MHGLLPRPKLGPKALTFILGSLMVNSVIASIIASDWAEGLSRLTGVMGMGLLIGAVFANLRWLPGWLAHMLALVLGTIWSIAGMAPLLGRGLPRWTDQASEVLLRFIFWVRTLERGAPGEDLILFIATMALITWWLAYATMWLLFRRGWPWVALVINAVVILINLTWALPKPTSLFFFFLLSALLLLVHETFRWRQLRWHSVGLEEQEFLSLRFLWTGIIVCTVLIGITALLPTSITSAQVERVWTQVKRPFNTVETTWNRAFNNINGPGGAAIQAGFSRNGIGLGGARIASNDVVMTVAAPRAEYWRSNAFDRYDPNDPFKWRNTTGELARAAKDVEQPEDALTFVEAGRPLIQMDIAGREPLTQTVIIRKDRSDNQLPAATLPYSYSLSVLIEHSFLTSANQGGMLPNFADTSIVYSPEPVVTGMRYTVVSMVSTVDKQSLREAGSDYPQWVSRYLQLPETPAIQAISELAASIAQGENVYDKAVAIETYLRQFKYNDQISAPPEGQDPVAWFLFERREGYCDYYASAMVLMLRSLGIPARFVQGYATGEYDEKQDLFVVRDTVAHSWPEVYFPGYGWQRFEPTPAGYVTVPNRPEAPPEPEPEDPEQTDPNSPNSSQQQSQQNQERSVAGIDLQELEQQLNAEFGNPNPVEPQAEQLQLPDASRSWVRRLTLPLTALLIATAGLVALSMRREVRGLAPAFAAYARLSQLARWAGVPQRPAATPAEYAEELSTRFPAQQEPIRQIIEAYTGERYGRTRASADVQHAMHSIQWPLLGSVLRRLSLRQLLSTGRRRRRRR